MLWTHALLRQQEIEKEIEDSTQRLAEIQQKLENRQAVNTARAEAQRQADLAEKARKAQETLEFELQRVQTKLQETEQKLYGGKVQNPRELAGLQSETQSLKRRQGQLEDELLEAMSQREITSAAAEKAAADSLTVEAAHNATDAQWIAERDKIQAAIGAMQKELARIQPSIPAEAQESYQRLRKRIGPLPVAMVVDGTCSVCGIELSAPTKKLVQAEKIAHCDGCNRLLIPD